MIGAIEYAKLFKTGQYGRFYITSGSHARGRTFHIQILPEGEKAIPNGSQNICVNSNAVEVYGIKGGNPGWTEIYDWLHKGAWQEDFMKLARSKQMEIDAIENKNQVTTREDAQQERERERVKKLLENYSK